MTRHFSEERGPEGRTNEIIFFFKIFNFLEKNRTKNRQNEKKLGRWRKWTIVNVLIENLKELTNRKNEKWRILTGDQQ